MTTRRWVEFAISIAVGHAIYSLLLFPELRGRPVRLDSGLLIDFALCVLVYAVIQLGVARARRMNARARRMNARAGAWRRRN